MIDLIAEHAGYTMLIAFATAFAGITVWIFWPGKKDAFERHARIPLKEVE